MERNFREMYKRADEQRLKSLKSAFKTIDCFAQPSLDPEMYRNYEEIRSNLIKNYSTK